jgi:hypothetical protein
VALLARERHLTGPDQGGDGHGDVGAARTVDGLVEGLGNFDLRRRRRVGGRGKVAETK